MVIMLIFKIYLLGHQVHLLGHQITGALGQIYLLGHQVYFIVKEEVCDIFQPGKMQKQTFTCRMAAPHIYLFINNNR